MIKKQYFNEMKSRIKSIVGVFLTVGVVKVNICNFWVATLTLTAGDGLKRFLTVTTANQREKEQQGKRPKRAQEGGEVLVRDGIRKKGFFFFRKKLSILGILTPIR
jgi:hypothetical protein